MFTGMKIMLIGSLFCVLGILFSVVLLIAKLTGYDTTWMIVAMPAIVSVALEAILVVVGFLFHLSIIKKSFKSFDI